MTIRHLFARCDDPGQASALDPANVAPPPVATADSHDLAGVSGTHPAPSSVPSLGSSLR
ncbi:MAG: hypothetical protein WA892_04790 [Ornithinimicrobium sp.]